MEEKLEEMLEEYYSYCDDKGDRIFNEYCVRELLKWYATQMYSEEDMREAFRQGHSSARKGSYNQITEQEDFDKWFEQFKKK